MITYEFKELVRKLLNPSHPAQLFVAIPILSLSTARSNLSRSTMVFRLLRREARALLSRGEEWLVGGGSLHLGRAARPVQGARELQSDSGRIHNQSVDNHPLH